MHSTGINKVFLVGQIVGEPRWSIGDGARQLSFSVLTRETIRSHQGESAHEESHQIRINEENPILKSFFRGKMTLFMYKGD
jgi:single-stranded DNA-binding protein